MVAVCLALGTSPVLAATDAEALRALHEKVMRAHRMSDIEVAVLRELFAR